MRLKGVTVQQEVHYTNNTLLFGVSGVPWVCKVQFFTHSALLWTGYAITGLAALIVHGLTL